ALMGIMTASFLKLARPAREPSATSLTTTPSLTPCRDNSSKTAGDRLITVMPEKGEEPLSLTGSRAGISGAGISLTETVLCLPLRMRERDAAPPIGFVAIRYAR